MEKKVIIVGAGLVGSLWAVYMAKAGYKVTIYERRSDIRKAEISAGKSINLALSSRGWKALKNAGVEEDVKEIANPMPNRTIEINAVSMSIILYKNRLKKLEYRLLRIIYLITLTSI